MDGSLDGHGVIDGTGCVRPALWNDLEAADIGSLAG